MFPLFIRLNNYPHTADNQLLISFKLKNINSGATLQVVVSVLLITNYNNYEN